MNSASVFNRTDLLLWSASVVLIVASFCLFDGNEWLTLIASLIGATSLIFNAKGHPVGQLLMIVFSILYGMISFSFAYYGEMLTYLGMTGPMAVVALISWLRHPFRGDRRQVEVGRVSRRELLGMLLMTAIVTAAFGAALWALDTRNLFFSTVSVTTSFAAVYLTARRSPLFALCYAANDIVLIILWIAAAREDRSYVSVVVCFAVFLVNDLYGFFHWRIMEKRQHTS